MYEEFKPLHEKQLNILKELHRICEKHQIRMFLYAGTLLGAIRHKGFIPWDHDMDVILPIKDLEMFIEISKSELQEPFFLQTKENDPNVHSTVLRLRNSDTTLIMKDAKNQDINHGVAIDIYPLYNVPPKWFSQKLQFIMGCTYLLFRADTVPQNHGSIKKAFAKICLLLPKRIKRYIERATYKYIGKFESIVTENKVAIFGNPKYLKMYYPTEWFESSILMPFEDTVMPIPVGWREFLTMFYGDYMTPPPELERVKENMKNFELIDTEIPYHRYRGIAYLCKKVYLSALAESGRFIGLIRET